MSRYPLPGHNDPVTVLRQKVFAATANAIRVANQSLAPSNPRLEQTASWIPKSLLCKGNELFEVGDTGKLIIPCWVADQKELEYEP